MVMGLVQSSNRPNEEEAEANRSLGCEKETDLCYYPRRARARFAKNPTNRPWWGFWGTELAMAQGEIRLATTGS